MLLFVLSSISFGQGGEGGSISFVRPDPSPAAFWDSNNCDGKTNITWIGFGLNSEEHPNQLLLAHVGRPAQPSLERRVLEVCVWCSL